MQLLGSKNPQETKEAV